MYMTIENKPRYIKLIMVGFCFMICSNVMRSQAYIPMLKYHGEWHVTNCNSGCGTDKYYTIGDTLINGLHYTFLDKFHYLKNFVVREDTASRRVYLRLLADPPPAKDYLLYDFSLQVNDTISITNPGSPYPKYPGNFIVDSIVLKPLVNKSHRYFYLHSEDTLTSHTKTTIWVEGIGSLCLINTPGALPQINGAGQLNCFFSNNVNEYSKLDSIADCISIYPVGVKELKNQSNYIISQNFDGGTISIKATYQDIENVQIVSTDGKLVYQNNSFEEHTIIHLNSFQKGLLLLKIENKAGNYYTYKLFNP